MSLAAVHDTAVAERGGGEVDIARIRARGIEARKHTQAVRAVTNIISSCNVTHEGRVHCLEKNTR